MLPPMDYQGHRILPFAYLITTSACPVLLACPRNPLWGFQCRVHLFHQLLLRIPKASGEGQPGGFSQLNLRIDPLIAWIYPSQKRAWLDCLSPIVAGWMLLLFRKHPRVLGWHAQVKTTKLGSYHLNRGWIEPRTKTKQKPYFTWNTQLFYWGGSLFHSFMT